MISLNHLIKLLIHFPAKRVPWNTQSTGYLWGVMGFLGVMAFTLFLSFYVKYAGYAQNLQALHKQTAFIYESQDKIRAFEEKLTENPLKFATFEKKKVGEPQTLEDLKSAISKLQKNLKVQFMNIQYGMVEEVSDFPGLAQVKVFVELKTLHDKQLFGFVDKIQNEIPGMVTLENFEIKRTSPLTQEMLTQIDKNKTVLFDCSLSFMWTFLRAK